MEIVLKVLEIIESPSALTVEQGNLLYENIVNVLKENHNVKIDFENIESIITPFLNASIGRLYETYTSDELSKRISIINQPEGTNRKFNMVIRNAKQFYADKEGYTKIIEDVLDKK